VNFLIFAIAGGIHGCIFSHEYRTSTSRSRRLVLTDAETTGSVAWRAATGAKIPPGKEGICRVRYNHEGSLIVPEQYVAGLQVDPIEKKPSIMCCRVLWR